MTSKEERMEAAMAMTNEREMRVQIKNLDKNFGDLLMLDNMNFGVKEGGSLYVVGPTGCGKMTFLKLLSYLIKPTKDSLLIDGEPASPRRHDLALVFRGPFPSPWLTVRDNIVFRLGIKKLPKQGIDRQIDNIINLMGLQKFQDSYFHQLLVSSKQRMVIGRSFAVEPDLLLVGGPYGRMDIKMRFYPGDEVIRLWKGMGITVVFITHNTEEATYLAERVLISTNKSATIKEEAYIDSPYPRNVADPEFIRLRKHITEQIKWQ